MNKVIYIKAHFKPTGEEVTTLVATGEKKKGFFGGEKDVTKRVKQWKQTGYSDCAVDGERLSRDISDAVEVLNNKNYEVISVTPVISGGV